MQNERRVRLFRNGRSQAIRIPKEFELEGTEAIVRKKGDQLVIEPASRKGLLATLAELENLEQDFPDIDQGLGAPDRVEL
ncbi:MAG: AbrB/MazE/SpoVT family DNA-binding domain-containing protein [Desulfovermiculus sp.]|nr:AbrB/MazE/SpoVT family DNA-binding domain-containing protein [Desulfovermiculus sp.]